MKHIICYSGGHSSALVAIEAAGKHGAENIILLNHDIPGHVEDADIKRFKSDVADYLGIPITYASHKDPTADQFDVCVQAGAFKVKNGQELCTNRLKTEPFMRYLNENHSDKNCIVYYGFDANETRRIQRRSSIMGQLGYKTEFPLALWSERTVDSTKQIGIEPPNTYGVFIHANCTGCLKAGKQHWYVVYCTRPDIWAKAKWAEEDIGHAIHHDPNGPVYLEDLEPIFERMKQAGVPATERIPHQKFWVMAKGYIKEQPLFDLPCECIF